MSIFWNLLGGGVCEKGSDSPSANGVKKFPGKVLADVCGQPMIEWLLRRLLLSELLDEVVVATTVDPSDDLLSEYLNSKGYTVFRGSADDVLGRFVGAANDFDADIIVRITGDCPLVDPFLVDKMISEFLELNVDYLCNRTPPTFPDGLDVEVFTNDALVKSIAMASSKYEREHVTPFLYESGVFKTAQFSCKQDYSYLRWTVDEVTDLMVITEDFDYFLPKIDFSWERILELNEKKPELFQANLKIPRNEGATMHSGNKLWRRAKKVIPGGNMLLSKRPEMFLPNFWPVYFSKSKACEVWDLDSNRFIDCSLMGVGTNILGYANEAVDAAVMQTVKDGNLSTLNCPEEVFLAEKMLELHPWFGMARLARTGGEANAVAVRIARAASGKEVVAFCGYHGWHDWYLSANIASGSSLDNHHCRD